MVRLGGQVKVLSAKIECGMVQTACGHLQKTSLWRGGVGAETAACVQAEGRGQFPGPGVDQSNQRQ